ncbi:hypothetical protein [Chryseobacterium kwangjuense]|uniref:hypothetical protein n=1 Tax=Chryseobacterium kwangjuense TaxID=267125 RepID=UPI0009FB8B0B|nr:hypothetical protein [Chryseobacterium kwangjuense]
MISSTLNLIERGLWQKDIKSSTQDFLNQVTTSINQQYLKTGSSIHTGPSTSSGNYLVAIKTDNNKTANAKLIKK